MTTTTPNQGIVEQAGTDPANLPSAQASQDGVIENRLVQRYTNLADRTARNPAPNENELSALAAEDRYEVFDSANWVSLFARSMFLSARVNVDQTINNVGVLTNVTGMVAVLPTTGTFQWRCELFYDSSTTEDIQFAFTWPGGGSAARWGGIGMLDVGAASGTGSMKANTSSASGTGITYGGAGVGTVLSGSLFGEITLAGTGGNLQLQFAQAAAAATNTTVRARSRMQVWRVA